MPTYECPTCQEAVTVATAKDLPSRPFCSQRCKMIDLGKWLDGTYTTSEPAKPEDYPPGAGHPGAGHPDASHPDASHPDAGSPSEPRP